MADSSNWRVRAPANTSSEARPTNCRAEDVKVHRPERQIEESPETLEAIAEGRRVYLGNLLYTTTPDSINEFLTRNGVASVTNVHISIVLSRVVAQDICFIDFAEKEVADKAMQYLVGRLNVVLVDQKGTGPNDALRNFQVSKAREEGRWLFVGGLPRMLDQTENELEIRSIFERFKIDGVSKRVCPRDNNLDNRRNFCFVNFVSREEAGEAVRAVDGVDYRDALLKVSMSISKSQRDRTSDRGMGMGMGIGMGSERNSRWG
ncbi:hypothetical protein ACHAP3_007449 [Botrytis cinerea]